MQCSQQYSLQQLYTRFTLHFRTLPGQRTVLAQIGCEQCEHTLTLLLRNHNYQYYSHGKFLVGMPMQLLKCCMTMVGRQLLVSLAEACG